MRPLAVLKREDSLQMWLSFFFIFGSITGTIFCNLMSAEMKLELISLERAMMSTLLLENVDFPAYFRSVLWKRSIQAAFVILAAMTGAARLLSLLLTAFLGFTGAVLLCVMTMEAGVVGILLFLLRNIPQALFYLMFFYLLFRQLTGRGGTMKLSTAAVLAVLILLGVFAESVLNPWILVAGKIFLTNFN